MLYRLNAQIMEAMLPLHVMARQTRQMLYQPLNPLNSSPAFKALRAGMELTERLTAYYDQPAWDLDSITINGETVAVEYEVAVHKPYCNLLHFRRAKAGLQQPKVLMIAPLSGHYATLLRGTVREFMPDHEVYITDWINARDVPLSDGSFRFDDYVDYLIQFLEHLGPDTHVLAVCQPCVPMLAAAAYMAKNNHPAQPSSMTLMGGPVDTRISPTSVNDYASGKDLEWFEDNVIQRVPRGFAGRRQLVYPGFIQLTGFMSMNLDSHLNKHFQFFNDLIKGDGDSAEAHRQFYNEYLAVMDMPGLYYLDTIRKVFLEHQLPKGEMEFRGQRIDLSAIRDIALLTVEGELDDITGRGQTSCALDLCSNIPAARKQHIEVAGVGHYGIFNGRRFRQEVAPVIKAFMQRHQQAPAQPAAAQPAAPAVAAEPAVAKPAAAAKPATRKRSGPAQPAATASEKPSSAEG